MRKPFLDIREFKSERAVLAASPHPEDWILSLLVATDLRNDGLEWLEVARSIDCELDPANPATGEYRTILLIASLLREVDEGTQEKISEMIELDVSKNRLLKQVFEQGMDAAYPLFLINRVKKSIKRNDLTIESELMKHIAEAPLDEIEAFADDLEDAHDRQDFLDMRYRGLSNGNRGNDLI